VNTTLTARPVTSVDITTRVEAIDWASASTHLDGYGWTMLKTLLTADECESIARFSCSVDALPLPPLPNRLCVNRVMAIGIEP